MTCSVGVCQCQGIEQPDAPLKTITDDPLEGSPLSTAMVIHAGSPAIGLSLFSDSLRSTPISSAWATKRQANTTAANFIASLLRRLWSKYIQGDGLLQGRP